MFCPECGHQERYDGDWDTVSAGGWISYHCPECQTEIATRPDCSEARISDADYDDRVNHWEPLGEMFNAWTKLWLPAVSRDVR